MSVYKKLNVNILAALLVAIIKGGRPLATLSLVITLYLKDSDTRSVVTMYLCHSSDNDLKYIIRSSILSLYPVTILRSSGCTSNKLVSLPRLLFSFTWGREKGSGTLTKDFLSQHSPSLGWVLITSMRRD